MQFVDSHSHIYLDKFDQDREEVITKAREAGIAKIFLPNIDSSSIESMLKLEEQYPELCIPMMGLHPCSVDKNYRKELEVVEEWLGKRSFSAIGEMGTDLYWDKSHFKEQIESFRIQAKWANDLDLPIIIHCRESVQQTIDLVKEIKENDDITGIFHCFTGTLEQAQQIVDLGFHIGLGGVLTFKNNGELAEVVKQIDIKHLVIETDSPYLAPVPFRGKRNEPAFLVHVARKIAEFKDISLAEVAAETTRNAEKIFRNENS